MEPTPFSQLFRSFTRIGLLSFGGPVAQIGVMHRELVETREWLSDEVFSRGLSFAMLLPGPEAMQLCTYAGWRLRGTVGGLLAGALFVLPGAVLMALISLAYLRWGDLPGVAPAFQGIKAAVIVVVAMALWRLGARVLTGWPARALALAAFLALALLALPFPLVVAAAALVGWATGDRTAAQPLPPARPWTDSLRVLVLWTALWLAPLAGLWAAGAGQLFEMTAFFSRLAVFSFGGAYAALAWMTQALVETHGWLTPQEMVDGLGLAETTPGPLVLVTQFSAMVAAAPLGIGASLAAAGLTLWAIFAPCFGLVFTFAPHLDALTNAPRLAAALRGVSAAVVGVIGALTLYFARHFFFPSDPIGPETLSLPALGLTALAAVLLGVLKRGLPLSLGLLAVAGALLGFVT